MQSNSSPGPLIFVIVRPGSLAGAVRRAVAAAGLAYPFGVAVVEGSIFSCSVVAAAFPLAHVVPFSPPEGAELIRAIGWPVVVA